eukprot:6611596-Pyramimonas_sp.AAC.1
MACASGFDWHTPPDVKEATLEHTLQHVSDGLSEDYALWSRTSEMVFLSRGCALVDEPERLLGRGCAVS